MNTFDEIEKHRKDMIELISRIVEIPAISPKGGGEGEEKRASFLKKFLEEKGFDVKEFIYKDDLGFNRPNLVVNYGNKDRTIWFVIHIDTVSPGDLSLWQSDPFKAVVKDNKIYGRGTNDDGQPIASAIYALITLRDLKMDPKYNFGIALVSDEEFGSEYGIKRLIKENIFKNNDMVIVPDAAFKDGKQIEIAEKSILWLKFIVKGKQVHASTPQEGINATKVMAKLINDLNQLYEKFNLENELFNPRISTFEPTKCEKNLDTINIIPARNEFYFDSRILPEYKVDEIIDYINEIRRNVEKETKASIDMEIINKDESGPTTRKDSEIVKLLSNAIKELRGFEPVPIGIGGGTVAKDFRKMNIDTVVWFTGEDVAHQPNEYINIDDMVNDAKVFAKLFI